MATITKSIGTSSRDYSTITLWEADLDNTGIYTSGDDAVGECYNDTAFDETITINGGGGVGLNSVKLSVASAERHDGTEGSGARIVRTGDTCLFISTPSGFNQKYTVEWLEIDGNGNIGPLIQGNSQQYTNVGILTNLIVHGIANGNSYLGLLYSNGRSLTIRSCVFYDVERNAGGGIQGITIDGDRTEGEISNCVVYNIYNPSTTGTAVGISIYVNSGDTVNATVKNNISMSITTGGGGSSNSYSVSFNKSVSAWDYNMSDDDTADDPGGSNNLINKSSSTQFVSTVSGSEDFHIVSTSDAVGAGADLATTSIDINGSDRNALAATVWDIGAHQYASTASIGTSSRDYSTITLWEADLDDTTIYGAGANAVGECYNDSAFDEGVIIDGGGTVGLSSVKLTAPSSQRHDGTAGSGARIVASASYGTQIKCSRASLIVEWLECDGDQISASTSYKRAIYSNTDAIIRNVILHDIYSARESFGLMTEGNSGGAKGTLLNSIIYNILSSGGTQIAVGIYIASGTSQTVICYNNTIFNISKSVNASTAIGIASNTINTLKNNIVIGTNGATTNKDFGNSGSNIAYNISSDGTASGTGSKTNQPASRQFVSTLSGSEDLHLIFKSAAIDAGVDLGTTPDGVQYDINGKDRDTENSIWDIGAHEYGDNVVFGLLRV